MTEQHEIKCSKNSGFRITRHDYIMKKIILKIDRHRYPRPVDAAHHNLPTSDALLRPDIEFKNSANQTFVLDVTFATDNRL